MLGKLIKYEFRNTRKMMGTIFVIMIVATILGCISLMQLNNPSISNSGNSLAMVIWGLLLALYVIAIIVLSCFMFVYLCVHYHKTMYSDQGYLTHTLPVKTSTIFGAKLFTSFVWFVVTGILCILSVFCLIWSGLGNQLWTAFQGISWAEFDQELYAVMGMHIGGFIAFMIFEMLLGCVYYFLFVFTSMAIGQLFGAYKTGASVLAGIIIYAIINIFGLIMAAVLGYDAFTQTLGATTFVTVTGTGAANGYVQAMMMKSMLWGNVLNILFIVACYVACVQINKKHLNLD